MPEDADQGAPIDLVIDGACPLARGPTDVRRAHASGRLGLLLHLQGGDPFGRDRPRATSAMT